MKKRLIISLIVSVLLLVAVSVPVVAANNNGSTASPMWDNVQNIDCTVAFVDDVGHADCVSHAQFGCSSIKTDIVVYKRINGKWIYVTETHDTKYQIVSGVSCLFDAEEGLTYRADYTFTMTRSGVDEIVERTVYKAN